MTAFADLTDAIVAALQLAPAVAGGLVMKNRLRPLPAGVSTAVVVRLDQPAQAIETALGAHDWATTFTAECYAKSTPMVDAEDAADALLDEVYPRLAGLSLVGLGVAQVAVQPSIEWQRDEEAAGMVCAVLRLTVIHRTYANTLTAWT